ncbi:DDE-type integrase/transposase/recombinase, partial [Streptomyces sp. NPDC005533]|uniref:DDE-type integrase/transposase/recombinase n=1 Tax=Streptomyces sp. NPDC005533 TaxID=3364723 RepID=UPI0036A670F8
LTHLRIVLLSLPHHDPQLPIWSRLYATRGTTVEHRSHKGLNNRAANSHQPTRQRERAMKGFRTVGSAQRFLSAFTGISPHFRPHRHLMTARNHRLEMTIRFTLWNHITGATGQPATA